MRASCSPARPRPAILGSGFDAAVTIDGDVAELLLERSDFGAEEDGVDGQLVWWGELTDDRDDEEERVVLDRLTPEPGRVRIQVNSQHRLRQLEYQSALPAERGGRPVDTAWLRAELGGAAPLRLAAAQLRVLGLTSIL